MISIINYGVGNLGSIQNMLKKIGIESSIASSVSEVEQATKIILPGVGAFDPGMQKVQEKGLLEVLNYKVKQERTPLLGICVGMQLLMEGSEEGVLPGFGWIPGRVKKFSFTELQKYKVPHMGWNTLEISKENPLLQGFTQTPKFYFVHSYYPPVSRDTTLAVTVHGDQAFASVIGYENILGVQFHPEKSHKFGMTLLKNFAVYC